MYTRIPLKPHYYIVKLGSVCVYILPLLYLLQNIDCGYSSYVYPQAMFRANILKLSICTTEFFIFRKIIIIITIIIIIIIK